MTEDKKHRSPRSNRCRDCGASTGHYQGCPAATPGELTAERQDVAIEASADALLAVCALQTGSDPTLCVNRAMLALEAVYRRAEAEQG